MAFRHRVSLDPLCLFLAMAGLACDQTTTDVGPAGSVSQTTSSELPKLGHVPRFSLRSERDVAWGSADLAGKPYVAAFMFTRCPTVCPRLTRKMVQVKRQLTEAEQDVAMVSISVDPDYDTPQALDEYKKKQGATFEDWYFLTGDFQTIAKTAEQGFKVALSGRANESEEHYGITHGSHLILVDREGQIRGYFRSTDDDVADQLVAAVDRLDDG